MKKNNKGFTLVELMIAVMVMAIVIVPMLRSFVTSHRVNARSRHVMRATTLAQNEMEIFEKEKIEDLLDTTKFDYTPVTKPNEADSNDPGIYVFTRDGIINDETGRDMFDVRITLNPERVSTSDLYYAYNTEEVLFMNTISGLDSATYIQRVRNAINENGQDEEVYKLYVTRQHPEGVTGTTWTVDHFARDLKRTITLKIEQEDQGGINTTVAKVRYDYESGYAEVPDEYKKYTTKDKVIFNNSQTLDDEGNPIELKSVYLFYAPRYEASKAGNADKIIIENKDKLPVNIYIIRQNIGKPGVVYGGNSTNPDVEKDKRQQVYDYNQGELISSNYQAEITIYEGFDENGKIYGNYFTNLKLPGEAGAGNTVNLELVDCDSGFAIPGGGNQIIGDKKMKMLGATETKDRIYTMEAAVYEHGADPLVDEPVARLTGTKIE